MTRFTHAIAHVKVERPDDGTNCQTNKEVIDDAYQDEGYHGKDKHIDPYLQCATTPTVSSHEIAGEHGQCNVEQDNKNSGLNKGWKVVGAASRVDETK